MSFVASQKQPFTKGGQMHRSAKFQAPPNAVDFLLSGESL